MSTLQSLLPTAFRRVRQGAAACAWIAILGCITAAQASFIDAAPAADEASFNPETVVEIARKLAEEPYRAPEVDATADANFTYDAYRDVRFRPEAAIWGNDSLPFQVHALPNGWLFKEPVFLYLVDGGIARRFKPTADLFKLGKKASPLPQDGEVSLSGFRIHGPLNVPDIFDEIIVFQGASYFRAVSRGHVYGTSARGLAINTASSEGEEFPSFRAFWVEKPTTGAKQIVVHALLDSPSITGAYRMVITPGEVTSIDVDHTLFPRVKLKNVGIAPLTSMNMLSPMNRSRVHDFRQRVHDADGLSIINGRNEHLWRPLNNPRRLQVSMFLDNNTKGFGLIQRAREFSEYQDLATRYHERPSVWVEPTQQFGRGDVVLVEIPTEEEVHDNVVAYWRPSSNLKPGKSYRYTYRMSWPDTSPVRNAGPWVKHSFAGGTFGQNREDGKIRFVVDYHDSKPFMANQLPETRLGSSVGEISDIVTQHNPETGGIRVSFLLDPDAADMVELRLSLNWPNDRKPEVWLYRWTPDQ